MRIVYFGSGEFGLPTLRALAQNHDVQAVVTQPDRPAGRGGKLTPTPIAAWAEQHLACPVHKPERVKEMIAEIRAIPADAWVVIAYGQYMPRALLEGRFAINLHASLLPRWRGAAPINAAVLAGDAETGNSVITLAQRMDAGEILGRSRRAIGPRMTAGELHDLLAEDGPGVVEGVLRAHAEGVLQPEVQDESLVTIAPKLSKGDGWVDFSDSAEACRRRVHGLTPWPGVTVRHREQPLKLLRVEALEDAGGGEPGALADAASGVVACGEGSLRVLEVQPAGKRPMPWADYARGRKIEPGERLIGGRP